MKSTTNDTKLPLLEVTCPECDGAGSFREAGERVDCFECHGSGTLPTEDGAKILRLVQNHLKHLLASA